MLEQPAGPRNASAEALRAAIDASPGRPLGRGYQASVTLHETPLGPFVVKEAHGGPLLGAAARRALRHEAEVYARLANVPGVPRCHGLLDGRRLVLEHVPGRSLRQGPVEPEAHQRFFAALLETLRAMHAAGVAHGDLKRKDNVLVGPGGRPYVIDFGIALLRREDGGRWHRLLFDTWRQMDLNAWIKLKHGRRPEQLAGDDAAIYRPLAIERVARVLRVTWQKLTFRRLRKRHRTR
ncbi:MAG TPA: phosphotransferase [Gammaproteobacteria bacterium]